MADGRQASGPEPGHDVGQLLEGRSARQQGVEGGIAQQVERERQPIGRRPARAAGRRDDTDLAGP